VTPESCWLGEDEEILLGPVDDPLPRLAALAEIFWAGLSQPLHLFSEAGFAYAERVHKDQGEGRALSAARTVWVGNEFSKKAPEGQDPYHRLVFRNLDPLDADFARLSREVFLPMLEHRRP
jgi:exonuclease V gamma subunit